MTAFEAELDRLVTRFVAQLADLARTAALQMVIDALERPHPSQQTARSTSAEHNLDPGKALRIGLRRLTKELHAQAIVRALERFDGNVSHAARALRIPRVSLQRMMRRLGVRRNEAADITPRASAGRRRATRARAPGHPTRAPERARRVR